MGTRIILESAFTESTGKTLSPLDALMPPQAGGVLLLDFSHSLSSIGSGVPTVGDLFNNIAWEQARSINGDVGFADDFAISFAEGNAGTANCARERTAKGGLHIAARQDVQVSNNGYKLVMNSVLANLIFAIRAHKFYASTWVAMTRPPSGSTGGSPMLSLAATTAPTSNYLTVFRNISAGIDVDYPPVGSSRLGRRGQPTPNDTTGPQFRNIGVNAPTGTLAAIDPQLTGWGAAHSQFSSGVVSAPGQAPSFALYRMYIEDLTVSGRSYAEVDALDYVLWQKEFSLGGKFYDDTWTAPATLAGA